jgi:enoyl-CoA hydratase/carnithine racemase
MTSLPPLKNARLELPARIAVLTFNRDDVRNALTSTVLASDMPQAIACARKTWCL